MHQGRALFVSKVFYWSVTSGNHYIRGGHQVCYWSVTPVNHYTAVQQAGTKHVGWHHVLLKNVRLQLTTTLHQSSVAMLRMFNSSAFLALGPKQPVCDEGSTRESVMK